MGAITFHGGKAYNHDDYATAAKIKKLPIEVQKQIKK